MMTFFSTDGHGFTLIFARALLVLAFIAEYFFARKRRGKTQTFCPHELKLKYRISPNRFVFIFTIYE